MYKNKLEISSENSSSASLYSAKEKLLNDLQNQINQGEQILKGNCDVERSFLGSVEIETSSLNQAEESVVGLTRSIFGESIAQRIQDHTQSQKARAGKKVRDIENDLMEKSLANQPEELEMYQKLQEAKQVLREVSTFKPKVIEQGFMKYTLKDESNVKLKKQISSLSRSLETLVGTGNICSVEVYNKIVEKFGDVTTQKIKEKAQKEEFVYVDKSGNFYKPNYELEKKMNREKELEAILPEIDNRINKLKEDIKNTRDKQGKKYLESMLEFLENGKEAFLKGVQDNKPNLTLQELLKRSLNPLKFFGVVNRGNPYELMAYEAYDRLRQQSGGFKFPIPVWKTARFFEVWTIGYRGAFAKVGETLMRQKYNKDNQNNNGNNLPVLGDNPTMAEKLLLSWDSFLFDYRPTEVEQLAKNVYQVNRVDSYMHLGGMLDWVKSNGHKQSDFDDAAWIFREIDNAEDRYRANMSISGNGLLQTLRGLLPF